MSWLDEKKNGIRVEKGDRKESRVPEGLWIKCPSCREVLHRQTLEENLKVCQVCGHHFRMNALERVRLLVDPDSFVEHDRELQSTDPLRFEDTESYREKLEKSKKKFNNPDAVICGTGKIFGQRFELSVFEFGFMGGSMGMVVGEKIARSLERALESKKAAVVVTASGGARMQEGILSLMQMSKINGLVSKLKTEGIPYLTLLTDPTTGGVAASFATQGDIIFAEPGALIGFAGPRVIEQSMKQSLPEGFQRSEFLLSHGLLDSICERKNLKREIYESIVRLGFKTCGYRVDDSV